VGIFQAHLYMEAALNAFYAARGGLTGFSGNGNEAATGAALAVCRWPIAPPLAVPWASSALSAVSSYYLRTTPPHGPSWIRW